MLGNLAIRINVAQRNRRVSRDRAHMTLAMRHYDRNARAVHAVEKQRGGFLNLDHAQPRLKPRRHIPSKLRPTRGSRNDLAQLRHHLATVANAQREAVRTLKELSEHLLQPVIKKNRLRPAAARAQHVTIRESATCSQSFELGKVRAPCQQIAHVHVN